MSIDVVPYTSAWVEGVHRFNLRMEAGGVHWRWYEDPVDFWIPKRDPAQKAWREHHLAVEDGTEVRGAYALTHREWRIHGEPRLVSDWQGPITEGILSRRYNTLGLRLLREMLKHHPLLYSWGHGGLEQPMLEMLRKLGWLLHGTPFCLRVARPARFLRGNRYLRSSWSRRLALTAAAGSGLGSLGLRLLHVARGLRGRSGAGIRAELVPDFGKWADELWERVRGGYAALALRDAATMNVVLPQGGWPSAIRLRVRDGDALAGWAVVLDTRMSGDARFGDLRVGSIVDCLADPNDPRSLEAVVGAAWRFLRDRGVDLVFANQSHRTWIAAFAAQGFLTLRDRRVFAASPALQEALAPLDDTLGAVHLTNLDGHGPMRM